MGRRRGPKVEKIPTTWASCNEGVQIVKELIAADHPHLTGVKVRVVLQSTDIKERGRCIAAKVNKIAGFSSWLANGEYDDDGSSPFFVIVFNVTAWQNANDQLRRAVLDRQLCQMAKDDKGNLSIKLPDASIYRSNIARYGLYTDELKLTSRTVNEKLQGTLEIVAGSGGDGKAA